MILFDLLCSHGHRFEAWFRDGDGFERQVAAGEITCAVCGDADVRKALMAPNVRTSRESEAAAMEAPRKEEAEPPSSAPPATIPADGTGDDRVAVSAGVPLPQPEKLAEAMRVLRQVQTHIEKNFDHVGRKFADEARKMHYGEAEKRSIYGEATKDEAEELLDEGIDINQVPWLPTRNS